MQDRLLERGQTVWDVLQNGGYLYVCGDAAGLSAGAGAGHREQSRHLAGGRRKADRATGLRRTVSTRRMGLQLAPDLDRFALRIWQLEQAVKDYDFDQALTLLQSLKD